MYVHPSLHMYKLCGQVLCLYVDWDWVSLSYRHNFKFSVNLHIFISMGPLINLRSNTRIASPTRHYKTAPLDPQLSPNWPSDVADNYFLTVTSNWRPAFPLWCMKFAESVHGDWLAAMADWTVDRSIEPLLTPPISTWKRCKRKIGNNVIELYC